MHKHHKQINNRKIETFNKLNNKKIQNNKNRKIKSKDKLNKDK